MIERTQNIEIFDTHGLNALSYLYAYTEKNWKTSPKGKNVADQSQESTQTSYNEHDNAHVGIILLNEVQAGFLHLISLDQPDTDADVTGRNKLSELHRKEAILS